MNCALGRAAAIVAATPLWFASPATRAAVPCAELAKQVRADVKARPERVLIIVEDAMVQNETCACEIVKSAILAARAGGKLVGQIVRTAVNVSPGVAPTIGECAVAAAPEAADEIKAALHTALSDGALPGPLSAKSAAEPAISNHGKKTPPSATGETDSSTAEGAPANAVAIAGIYLVIPTGSPPPAHLTSPIAAVPGRRRPPRARVIVRPPDVTAGASDDPPP
jgi:hypothetical protein